MTKIGSKQVGDIAPQQAGGTLQQEALASPSGQAIGTYTTPKGVRLNNTTDKEDSEDEFDGDDENEVPRATLGQNQTTLNPNPKSILSPYRHEQSAQGTSRSRNQPGPPKGTNMTSRAGRYPTECTTEALGPKLHTQMRNKS